VCPPVNVTVSFVSVDPGAGVMIGGAAYANTAKASEPNKKQINDRNDFFINLPPMKFKE
jgi:hypothetical protein